MMGVGQVMDGGVESGEGTYTAVLETNASRLAIVVSVHEKARRFQILLHLAGRRRAINTDGSHN